LKSAALTSFLYRYLPLNNYFVFLFKIFKM